MANEANQQREGVINRAWDGMENAYQGVADRASGLADRASHLGENTTEYVKEAPFTATLVSFGVGVGLGLLVAQLLVPERRPSRWYDSYLGDDRARSLENMVHRYLPNSMTSRMGM